jgi:hypothetical protein
MINIKETIHRNHCCLYELKVVQLAQMHTRELLLAKYVWSHDLFSRNWGWNKYFILYICLPPNHWGHAVA